MREGFFILQNNYYYEIYNILILSKRGYYHTLTRKGTVFMGTGTGTGKNTRGLPVSLPRSEEGGWRDSCGLGERRVV